jgi:hypothetical protein
MTIDQGGMMTQWPTAIANWEGFQERAESEILVERGFIDHWLEAVHDANPLYWDESAARPQTGSTIAPPAMLLTWIVSRRWSPSRPDEFWDARAPADPRRPPRRVPIDAHYALKEFLGLKEGIVSGNEMEFYEPVRLGDRLHIVSRIYEIGEERKNRLGTGRPWTVEVSYFNQRDELVGIERYRFFSYNGGG